MRLGPDCANTWKRYSRMVAWTRKPCSRCASPSSSSSRYVDVVSVMSRAERRHSTTSGVSGVMDRMPSATGGPLSFAVVALRASLSRFLLAAVVVDDPMVGRSHTVCLQLWELLFDLDFQPESSAHTCAAVSVVWNLTNGCGGMHSAFFCRTPDLSSALPPHQSRMVLPVRR